jgi:hypothetical protein
MGEGCVISRTGLCRQWTGFLLCGLLPLQPLHAQATMMVPVGGDNPKPVPQQPVADADDSAEDIAKDAARDLKDSRFYNKPGATRADYDAAWQECRLIARGSRTPSGMVPYYYNPAVVSPLAAGIGAGLGGLFANMIVQGEQRRQNRRQCLLIRGWRLVEVPKAQADRIALMTEAQRDDYFNSIVGAEKVDGEITERKDFTQLSDPSLNLDAPIGGTGVISAGKKADPAAPIALAENEGLIALAFRRTVDGSAGRSGAVTLARYDVVARDLIYQPKDWKKKGDMTTYRVSIASNDKKAVYEVELVKVTAGDYVLDSFMAGPGISLTSNCFGAPTFHVAAGELVYAGDFVPVINGKLGNGTKIIGTFWTRNLEEARKAVAAKQPALAGKMAQAAWRNQATYACAAQAMNRLDLPGVSAIEPPAPSPAPAALPGSNAPAAGAGAAAGTTTS